MFRVGKFISAVLFWKREPEEGVVASSSVVLASPGPPGTCLCSPFSLLINGGGRARGCWLFFPLSEVFLGVFYFAGSSCVCHK